LTTSAVTTGASSKLYWVLSPANVKKLAMKASSTGAPAWPSLTVNGGDIAGIAVLPSDQIASTAAVMFAGDALAGNSDPIRLDGTEQAAVQLDTSPDSPATATTTMLSLWQTDHRALRAERFFGFTVTRASGIASLSGVSY
jgi:capsid protein